MLHTCTQVAYATSADAGGSAERVVGYAGMLWN
jgi:AmmeMemoRadiSam system protein B